MDPLSDVLSFLRLTSYRIGGFMAGGDWSVWFGAQANVKCYAVIAGACWLAGENAGNPVHLRQGHCFLLPHGRPFRIASDLSLPPEDWRPHFVGSEEGALVRLNDGAEVTVLGSHFALAEPQAEILLGMMPPVVHLHDDSDWKTLWWAFERMQLELAGGRPGGSSPLPRRKPGRGLAVRAVRPACRRSDRGDAPSAGAALDSGGAGPRGRPVALRPRGTVRRAGRHGAD